METSSCSDQANGKVAVAVFVKIAHQAVIRVLAAEPSVSCLILDGEHGAFTDADLEILCALIGGFGRLSIVRVPWADAVVVGRALDRGADGVMVPRVQSADEARQVVHGLYVPPYGTRGWDPTVAAENYGAGGNRFRRQPFEPRCLIQIETAGALQDAVAIAQIRGVTDLFVGPADLSRALGSEREVFTAEVIAAMESLPGRVSASDVGLGAFVDSPERARWAYDLGYRFLAIVPDAVLLSRAVRAAAEPIARLATLTL